MVKDKMLDVEEEKMAKTNDDGLSYEEKYDGDDDAHNSGDDGGWLITK